MCAYLVALFGELGDESLAALGVGVAAVHEAVYEGALGHAVFAGDVNEFEEVVERRVNAAVGGEAHEVDALAVFLGIGIGANDFGILENGTVGAGAVDFHQVLVDDAASTDIEVAHLRVAHLSVGQTDIFARSQQLRVRIRGVEVVHKGSRSLEDDVTLAVCANAPTIKNHQESFLCHNILGVYRLITLRNY